MKESDDIGKLFALFDGGKAKQYHEVHEADQQRETIERWPLFKQVRVGSQAHAAAPSPDLSANASMSSSGHPTAVSEALLQPPAAAPIAPGPSAGAAHPAVAELLTEPANTGPGSLKSLFKRLEGPSETMAFAKPAAANTEQPSGSIRSLFDRLRRP